MNITKGNNISKELLRIEGEDITFVVWGSGREFLFYLVVEWVSCNDLLRLDWLCMKLDGLARER